MKHATMASAVCLVGALMIAGCGRTAPSDTTVLHPVDGDPTISISIMVMTGAQNDPAGREGLANLVGALVGEGATKTNSYEQILEKLYPLAAGYDASVDKEATTITGRVHRDNLDAYYPLLVDAIVRPAFTEEDFARVKSDIRNSIDRQLRYANDEELGKAAFYDFVYAGTPYGHLNAGTLASLDAITLDDVRAFHAKWYTRENVVIGVGGGYDDALVERLQKDLAALPEGKPQQPAPPVVAPINGHEVLLVEKECDATAISFGFPIPVLRGSDDFFALALFNSWFGEHRNSSSHLYQVIREARGMNYGDYSYIEIFPNGGRRQMPPTGNVRRQQLFEVWIRPVPHAQRHFALRAAMRELTKVVESGMTQEQFDATKKFLVKYALHFAETTGEQLGYAMDGRFYGIESEYIDLFRSKVEALTLGQVNAAIRKHLQVANVKIAMVTSGAAAFRDALVAGAPSPITYESPKPDAVLAEDKEIEIFPLAITADKVRIIPVDDMFVK